MQCDAMSGDVMQSDVMRCDARVSAMDVGNGCTGNRNGKGMGWRNDYAGVLVKNHGIIIRIGQGAYAAPVLRIAKQKSKESVLGKEQEHQPNSRRSLRAQRSPPSTTLIRIGMRRNVPSWIIHNSNMWLSIMGATLLLKPTIPHFILMPRR